MDLREYLSQLSALHLLTRISSPVSCDLELAGICRREFASAKGNKALLFPELLESDLGVVANLFGSQQRLLLMLRSSSLDELAGKLRSFLGEETTASEKKRIVPAPQAPLSAPAKSGLGWLPAVRTWPGEAQRYFTLALTVTQHPETGAVNVGLYRAQRRSGSEIALNFAPGSGAAKHLEIARQKNTSLPVALVFGGDPALIWAAAAPLPEEVDEFAFCAQVFASENRFISCQTQDLLIPDNSELVIEGEIAPFDTCEEGPFGNHTGQYVTRKDCPLLRVSGMLARPEPLLPMTVVGPPPSENVLLGLANEVYIREWLKLKYPIVQDIRMPLETIFHGASLLTVDQSKQKTVRELNYQLRQTGPLKDSRLLIYFDTDIDIRSVAQCWWRAINMLSTERLYQESGKLSIDATGIDFSRLVKT